MKRFIEMYFKYKNTGNWNMKYELNMKNNWNGYNIWSTILM